MVISTLALLLGLALTREQLAPDTLLHLPVLGGATEDRIRLEQLRGARSPDGWLVRSPSHLVADPPIAGTGVAAPPFRVRWLAPELRGVWNSALPFSLNEGALWAGRGLSTRLSGGALVRTGRVTLILAPQLLFEQNRSFQTVSRPEISGEVERHPLASPFHYPPSSMDLPQRFGGRARVRIDPGQSSLTVRAGALGLGGATENLWWGPGIRNALLMGAQAPGIPHLFAETADPLETPLGAVRARWILGRLTESDYFDDEPSNDHRSLSALVLTLTPAFDRGLTVGAARAVFSPSGRLPLGAALDVFRNVGRPAAEPGDTLLAPGPDQLFSVFGRWVFPTAGLEVYGEWGRYEQPRSLRDFVELPQHSRAYTVGVQYVRPAGGDRLVRLQSEVTSLEPSQSFRVRQLGEWYASPRVPQGYTHDGRVVGAAIGPSGSSQWAAADWLQEGWSVGGFVGRVRWENQALYNYLPEFRRADVSFFPGVRGGGVVGPVRFEATYAYGVRLNYLFQARPVTEVQDRGVDLVNHTLSVTLTAAGP